MNLDPAKVFVILVIALIVLGPERLPKMARQAGAMWREFMSARARVVDEIRERVPDLDRVGDIRSFLFDPERNGTSGDGEGPQLRAVGDDDRGRRWTPLAPQVGTVTHEDGHADPTMN